MISEKPDTVHRKEGCNYHWKRRTAKPKRCANIRCQAWLYKLTEEAISLVPITEEMKSLAKEVLDDFIESRLEEYRVKSEVVSKFISPFCFISLLIDVAVENNISGIQFGKERDSVCIFKDGLGAL